jgi:ribosomal protein S7
MIKRINKNSYVYDKDFNKLLFLYIKTIIGRFIKRGNKFRALKLYKKLKEIIKFNTEKKRKNSFIFLLSMLNSISKISLKEIRLGSQKKEIPMPINKKKQVLSVVNTLMRSSTVDDKLNFNRLAINIISSFKNKGTVIKQKKLIYKKGLENKILLNIFRIKNRHLIQYNINYYNKNKNRYNVSKKNNSKIYKNKTTL